MVKKTENSTQLNLFAENKYSSNKKEAKVINLKTNEINQNAGLRDKIIAKYK